MLRSEFWDSQSLPWVRLTIIAGILFCCAALPFQGSRLGLALIPGLLLGVAGLLAFMRWPTTGLIAAVAGGIFVPFDGPSGLNVTMLLVALLLVLWLLQMMLQESKIYLASSPTLRPLSMLLAASIFSVPVGLLPWFRFAQTAPLGAQLGGLSMVVLSIGAFLLAENRIPDVRWLQGLTWAFLACAAIYIIGRLVPGLRLHAVRWTQPWAFGSLFWAWVGALAFSQGLLNRDLHIAWRTALLGLVGAALYVAYVQSSGWKSGWVPLLAAVAVIIWLRSWKWGVVITLLAAIPAADLLADTFAADEYSYSTRMDAWRIMAEIIKVNPFLGLGFGNYRFYTPLFPIRGYAVEFNSHNQYVDIVAQIGFVGLFCFFWVFAVVGWVGWRLRNQVAPGFDRAYVYGALGGLAATLVAGALGDWIIPFFYNISMRGFRASVLGWLFLGGLLLLYRLYSADSHDPNAAVDSG